MANKKQIWKPQQRNLLDFLPRPRNMVKLIYDQQRRLNLTETKQHSLQLFALVPNTIFCRILIPYSQFCCCSIFPSSPQAALSLLSGWSGGHQLHYNHPGAAVSLSSSQYKLYSTFISHVTFLIPQKDNKSRILYSSQISYQIYNYKILDSGQISH